MDRLAAALRGIEVLAVEVEVTAEFGAVGEPARSITYTAHAIGKASEARLRELLEHTDQIAEIQNTLRQGMAVRLTTITVESRD